MIPAGYLSGIKGKRVKNTAEYFEKRNAHGEMPTGFLHVVRYPVETLEKTKSQRYFQKGKILTDTV
jgi:hypothetical protein